MAETYCGKRCEDCAHKECLGCPGCQTGPGSPWSEACELAKCCREKGHQTCGTCSYNVACGILHRRDAIPEDRLRALAAEAERKARVAQMAPFMGKWLWILFWLVVWGELASLMKHERIVEWVPALHLPGQILTILCSAVYGLILLKLAPASAHYRTSGICCLVAVAVSAVVACISGGGEAAAWTLILTLPAAVVGLVGEYQEYMAHGEALNGVDSALSEKWRSLWKWYIGTFAAVFGSFLVILIIPFLGLLVLLAGAIGLCIVSILKWVYLYQTAKVFRTYS